MSKIFWSHCVALQQQPSIISFERCCRVAAFFVAPKLKPTYLSIGTTKTLQYSIKGIGLTPLIALIWIIVEPAVTRNCIASVTNKQKHQRGPMSKTFWPHCVALQQQPASSRRSSILKDGVVLQHFSWPHQYTITLYTSGHLQILWDVFAEKSADFMSFRISFITISREDQCDIKNV